MAQSEGPPRGGPARRHCLCLESFPPGSVTALTDFVRATIEGISYDYPLDYGLNTCDEHDRALAPFCDVRDSAGEFDPSANPSWCTEPWCFIDPRDCKLDVINTTYFDKPIYYSYATCSPAPPILPPRSPPRPPPPQPPRLSPSEAQEVQDEEGGSAKESNSEPSVSPTWGTKGDSTTSDDGLPLGVLVGIAVGGVHVLLCLVCVGRLHGPEPRAAPGVGRPACAAARGGPP